MAGSRSLFAVALVASLCLLWVSPSHANLFSRTPVNPVEDAAPLNGIPVDNVPGEMVGIVGDSPTDVPNMNCIDCSDPPTKNFMLPLASTAAGAMTLVAAFTSQLTPTSMYPVSLIGGMLIGAGVRKLYIELTGNKQMGNILGIATGFMAAGMIVKAASDGISQQLSLRRFRRNVFLVTIGVITVATVVATTFAYKYWKNKKDDKKTPTPAKDDKTKTKKSAVTEAQGSIEKPQTPNAIQDNNNREVEPINTDIGGALEPQPTTEDTVKDFNKSCLRFTKLLVPVNVKYELTEEERAELESHVSSDNEASDKAIDKITDGIFDHMIGDKFTDSKLLLKTYRDYKEKVNAVGSVAISPKLCVKQNDGSFPPLGVWGDMFYNFLQPQGNIEFTDLYESIVIATAEVNTQFTDDTYKSIVIPAADKLHESIREFVAKSFKEIVLANRTTN